MAPVKRWRRAKRFTIVVFGRGHELRQAVFSPGSPYLGHVLAEVSDERIAYTVHDASSLPFHGQRQPRRPEIQRQRALVKTYAAAMETRCPR